MPYVIQFLPEAADDWQSLDHSVRKKLTKAIERLKNDPAELGKSLGGSLHGLRRIRSGDYRIVYSVRNAAKVVDICVVCHREDVYQIAVKRRLV